MPLTLPRLDQARPLRPHARDGVVQGIACFGRRALAGVAALAASLLLAGCQPAPVAPLKVGMNSWIGYDPLVLARDGDWIDRSQVKVVELSSSSETLRSFRNGLIDAAALTLDEALRLADEGQDLRVVALLDASAGADVVVARPGIDTPQALKGETVAVESSTVGALMLYRLLQAGGLQAADVTVLNLEAGLHLEALTQGRAAAAITYQPLAGTLHREGFNTIFDSAGMRDELLDVLVVRSATLAQRPAQVDQLVAAWRDGLALLVRDPDNAARELARGSDMTAEEYAATLDGLAFYSLSDSLAELGGQPPALARNGERLVQTLLSTGALRALPDWNQLIDPGPVRRVAARGSVS
ncbi:MAG: ABC transporter substrate-binding protein [Hydrogenophaga sp.]|jgi:NitT/TauT family transport system substrate-binding protein|nr:ABC transporter substrate-binding protein [Hydrogenophaga sp.]